MQHVDSDNYSSDYEAIFQDDFTDIDSSSDTEKILNSDADEENKLLYLTKIGYLEAEASIVMERCGSDLSIAELTDIICVAQMAKAVDALLSKQRKLLNEDDHVVHLLNLMIGFGVLIEPDQLVFGPKCHGSAKLTENIHKALETYDDKLPSSVHKYVIDECQKWNLVWVGRNKVVPFKPDEVEMLLGFPKNHTRGFARDMFPGGINVFSLFSGISNAEVAFYCLGIPLKTDA
ncbi:hypothetical protein F3Y22_tig00110013pilonHSYRG00192 [Hibiscus syriacus]|uniref:DNA (Cytosine-5)-methyltransferase DRM1/2 n=1 Tax=Hibiscus syriacus TaxID=106335 RepID=A0A6A3BSN0_HIBSY|nr:hypothetical protein F3Y22_tig00110013pilonHSYRG00192 [Hibiscus syriacus]